MKWRMSPVTVCGFAAGMLGLALLLDTATGVRAEPAGCDDQGPSESIGSCQGPPGSYQCSSFHGNQVGCTSKNITKYQVKQDFPTSCVPDQIGYNCNEPDKNCYQTVECSYLAGVNQCVINPFGALGPWVLKPKKVWIDCTTGQEVP